MTVTIYDVAKLAGVGLLDQIVDPNKEPELIRLSIELVIRNTTDSPKQNP